MPRVGHEHISQTQGNYFQHLLTMTILLNRQFFVVVVVVLQEAHCTAYVILVP